MSQPYKKGPPRLPGAVLGAMTAGKPALLAHPMDARRVALKKHKKPKKKRRKAPSSLYDSLSVRGKPFT